MNSPLWTAVDTRAPVKFAFSTRTSSRASTRSSIASARSSSLLSSAHSSNSSVSNSSISSAASSPSDHHLNNGPRPLGGARLFQHVRHKFQRNLGTLADLQAYLEMRSNRGGSGARDLRSHQPTVQSLLGNMMVMAKWLVDFLDTAEAAGTFDLHTPAARTTVRELRVELHSYSWRVTRITAMLKECG